MNHRINQEDTRAKRPRTKLTNPGVMPGDDAPVGFALSMDEWVEILGEKSSPLLQPREAPGKKVVAERPFK